MEHFIAFPFLLGLRNLCTAYVRSMIVTFGEMGDDTTLLNQFSLLSRVDSWSQLGS